MVKPLYCYLFLPVTLCAALCTDTPYSFKVVCIGNSVEVFRNVTSTFFRSEYTFYKIFGNENKPETIATWVMQNLSTKAIINPNYSQKVSLENETILLQDFQASDEAIYGKVLYVLPSSYKRDKVKLCALVPPTLGCKPNITRVEHFLDASLDNQEYCGTPSVSVRWMEYPGVVHINKSRIELQPGNESGTYRACIEGDNLNCVNNSSLQDNCENITLGSSRGNNDIPQLKTNTDMIVAIVVPLVLIFVIVVIAILINLFWKRQCGKGSKCVHNVNCGQSTSEDDVADTDAREADQETFPLQQDPSAQQCGIGSKSVPNVNGGQTTNSQSKTQDDVADPEDREADQKIVPFVQDEDIELQQMSSVHHQLET